MKDGVRPSFGMNMRTSILALFALALATSTARAESSPHKDPGTAAIASVSATLAPAVVGTALAIKTGEGSPLLLVVGAVMLGPSAGHWYAGEGVTTGLGLRLAGAVLAGATVAGAGECLIIGERDGATNCRAWNAGFTAGAIAVVAGMAYDFATVGDAARRHNARTISIAPTMVSGTRSTGAGVGLTGAF